MTICHTNKQKVGVTVFHKKVSGHYVYLCRKIAYMLNKPLLRKIRVFLHISSVNWVCGLIATLTVYLLKFFFVCQLAHIASLLLHNPHFYPFNFADAFVIEQGLK